ncbi:ATP-binding protein [Rhodobium gokarnense]|uniref:Cdc6-like AAA superfamily ATPase n=1 Tax=Rhodobium gokarnense TaxID=364296 RepID=A0ABT3HCM3_9HYPH|nr:ATP-binding protein [Rhodobium gokarnense]MCW2308145.1 Cdc6-like AAA superfamily ATPase [Rhodobium gokarnense]
MNPLSNPYAPGAGTPPPELAGRDAILEAARLAVAMSRAGKPARSLMLVGLRGVGKTVLLNEIQEIADEAGAFTDFIEVSRNEPLSVVIVATLRAALLKFDRMKGVSETVKKGLRVLKSFVSAIKLKYGDVEFSVDVEEEAGVADSGTLRRDLAELFVAAAEAAKARNTSIVLLIDEIQTLAEDEFEALIMAIHRIDQKRLPLLVVGAGLPLLVKLSGEAKSYAERLFDYNRIGALDDTEAERALVAPASAAGVAFKDAAIARILEVTEGYPYFLQEWGYQCWNTAKASPITERDVKKASEAAIARLDENFFQSRFARLSDPQKRYLRAMAELGPGPHRSGDIARAMGKTSQNVAPIRDALISNGMIYSPKYGFAAFTVPLFDAFLKRTMPDEA